MRRRLAILTLASLVIPSAYGQLPPPSDVSPDLESSATSSGGAAANPQATQLAAARANAAAALRDSVLTLELGHGLHVRELVERTDSSVALSDALNMAQEVGGGRWVNDQTCQVQLTVPGSAVADAVSGMVARYPGGHPPVRADLLSAKLANWRRTAFSATGSSAAGGAAVQQVRPRQSSGRWASVPEDVYRRTLAAAQADAVHQASDDLRHAVDPLPPVDRAMMSDALARPGVETRVRSFLDRQPVTQIVFHDDLTVSLSMTVDGAGLGRVAQHAVTEDQPKLSADLAKHWEQFRAAVLKAIPPSITGTAAVAAPQAVASPLPVVVLPVQPPDWVEGLLTAQGSATAVRGPLPRLKTQGAARAAAIAELRNKLLAVRIGPGATLGDAAKDDPQLAAAVSRLLVNAQENQVTFKADGSVSVTVNLNLRDAWDQLRTNP